MTPHRFTRAEPTQHDFLHLADALATVPCRDRAALAQKLIGQAKTDAARFPGSHWTAGIMPAALGHRHAVEGPNPERPFYASLGTEDGIAALEIALDALRAEVRAAERVAA